jgi:hypothetical protein
MPSAQLPSPFPIFKGSICESGQVVTCSLIILIYSYLRFLKQQVYTGFWSLTLALGVQELYKSIGVGTDDSSLIQVITTRAEIDMLYTSRENFQVCTTRLSSIWLQAIHLETTSISFLPLWVVLSLQTQGNGVNVCNFVAECILVIDNHGGEQVFRASFQLVWLNNLVWITVSSGQ